MAEDEKTPTKNSDSDNDYFEYAEDETPDDETPEDETPEDETPEDETQDYETQDDIATVEALNNGMY